MWDDSKYELVVPGTTSDCYCHPTSEARLPFIICRNYLIDSPFKDKKKKKKKKKQQANRLDWAPDVFFLGYVTRRQRHVTRQQCHVTRI